MCIKNGGKTSAYMQKAYKKNKNKNEQTSVAD